MAVTMSVRGQIVIPADIRKKYRINPQSKVEFIDTGREIVMVPLPRDSFRSSFGVLKSIGVKDLIAQRRAERKNERKKTR